MNATELLHELRLNLICEYQYDYRNEAGEWDETVLEELFEKYQELDELEEFLKQKK